MSDRREQVAKAIYESVTARYLAPTCGTKWDFFTDADPVIPPWEMVSESLRNNYRIDADAALSALDAEPTNAEIVEIQEDIFRTESRYIDKSSIRSVLRSALIAVRKAGK